MELSKFGNKVAKGAGIVELMEDLGAALNENPDMIFMGGGNPARIQPVEAIFKQHFEKLLTDTSTLPKRLQSTQVKSPMTERLSSTRW